MHFPLKQNLHPQLLLHQAQGILILFQSKGRQHCQKDRLLSARFGFKNAYFTAQLQNANGISRKHFLLMPLLKIYPTFRSGDYFFPIRYNLPWSVTAYSAPSFPWVTSRKRCNSSFNKRSSPTTLLFSMTRRAMCIPLRQPTKRLFFHSGIWLPL